MTSGISTRPSVATLRVRDVTCSSNDGVSVVLVIGTSGAVWSDAAAVGRPRTVVRAAAAASVGAGCAVVAEPGPLRARPSAGARWMGVGGSARTDPRA